MTVGNQQKIDDMGKLYEIFIRCILESAGAQHETLPEEIRSEISDEIKIILSQIPSPSLGDDSLMRNLQSSVPCFAFAAVMARRGWDFNRSGAIIYEACRRFFTKDPFISSYYREKGKTKFDESYKEKMKIRAEESQKRRRPVDFVFDYVEGDGVSFSYGVNYHRCGIMELAEKLDMTALMHYMCLADYPIYRAFGIGLKRTGTLAQGKPFCDFRFSEGPRIELETPEPPEIR